MKMLQHDSVCSLIETYHSNSTVFISACARARARSPSESRR